MCQFDYSEPPSIDGIDYAGSLQMREFRLHKARCYKVYIAVFVYMTVKTIQSEIVLNLSTNTFLAAFHQFFARRGLPPDIFSDCGTKFVWRAKQFRILVNHTDNNDCTSVHASCAWHFNPPSAPHSGGL